LLNVNVSLLLVESVSLPKKKVRNNLVEKKN